MRTTIFGEEFEIIFEKTKFLKTKVYIEESKIHVYLGEFETNDHMSVLVKWLKKFCKEVMTERVDEFCKVYGFEYNKLSIKDQSTRWGSCSSKKNLNFNWRLMFAPSVVCDYVIVHEICHLKEMNHSQNFWNLVESIMPEYKSSKLWLRENGSKIKSSDTVPFITYG